QLGEGVLAWRDEKIIPRYSSAGVTKFAFLVPDGAPGTVESGGTPSVEGRASFPTGWFSTRERAYQWLGEGALHPPGWSRPRHTSWSSLCWRSDTSAHGWCGSRWRSPSERRSGCFFRYVALQVLSAQHFGFGISDTLPNEISWGTWQVHFSRWLAPWPLRWRLQSRRPGCLDVRSRDRTRPAQPARGRNPREGARIGVGVTWP